MFPFEAMGLEAEGEEMPLNIYVEPSTWKANAVSCVVRGGFRFDFERTCT